MAWTTKLKKVKMDQVCVFLVLAILFQVVVAERIASEYFTAFINVSYYDHKRGVYHTERTETGRYSSHSSKEVQGLVVELISNHTNPNDNETHVIDRSGTLFCCYFLK